MRPITLFHLCGLSLVLMLAGCDAFSLLPWIFDPQSPQEPSEPSEPAEPIAPSIEHASTFLPIEGGRVLSATTQGFRIIDLRDPRNPRVEGSFALASERAELYRMGDHVILVAAYPRGYGGERDDVPVRREAVYPSATLFNLDIRDRSQPTLINEIRLEDQPRHFFLRRTRDGQSLFVLPLIWNGDRYQSRVDRYELRGGVLEQTAQLTLDGSAEAISATPDRLLAATEREDDQEHPSVVAIDLTQPQLSAAFSTSFSGLVGGVTQLALSGEQVRVLYSEQATLASQIATFQLSAPATPSGTCSVGSATNYELDASQFADSAHTFLVGNANGAGSLEQLVFDASGGCPKRRTLAADSRGFALQALAHDKLLVLGAEDVRLYDTTGPSLLAKAAVSARFAERAQESLRLTTLQQPVAAEETLLASVLYTNAEHAGRYELLTLSDSTLIPRGTLDTRGHPEDLVLLGRSLVAVSSTQLRTFDARELDAPPALGELELAERYSHVFGLGEHVARIRQHPAVLPPGERGRTVRDDLQVLRDNQIVASLPVESEGQWLQLGSLLVNAQTSIAVYGDESERRAQVAIQIYDLSDPTQPRTAGALSTTEIEAEWTSGHFYEPLLSYHAVGDALVIPQRKRIPDVQVRQCWKTVDYDSCRGDSSPDCTSETYMGTLICRSLDGGPEQCTGYDLSHCNADGCETLSELPDGIPSIEDGCNDYAELGRATTFAFNVIDLRDSDQPTLIRPLFALPDDNFLSDQLFVNGAKVYATELDGDALFASEIDFSDPAAPQLTPRQQVSGRVVAATDQDMYTGPRDYNQSDFTLERRDPQPSATRSWSGRTFESLQPDGSGHLLLVHSKPESSEPEPDLETNWTRLEILDAQTLATLSTLNIDRYGVAVRAPSDGRLLIDGKGALFLIDVRDAQLPRVQAAVPHHYGPVVLERGQLIISDELGFRSYASTLENLIR